MSVLLKTTGLLATLQDLGRIGYRRFGINPNGAMDKRAARLANVLLGNEENTAVLEMHYPAPTLSFEENAIIALDGADFSARLDEQPLENWRPVFAAKNSVLRFTDKKFGARLYLAVKGGFAVEKWLESNSTNLTAKAGGFCGRALQKGDRIDFSSKSQNLNGRFNYKVSPSLIPVYTDSPCIRVVAGAEWQDLTEESQQKFLTEKFTIKNESDRMGFRLQGEAISLREKLELVSSAVNFGTIQLLPDGRMIILMADHQTTGGYPRIAHVTSVDLPLLAQLNANDQISFKLIPLAEAEQAILELETQLNFLKTACQFLWSR